MTAKFYTEVVNLLFEKLFYFNQLTKEIYLLKKEIDSIESVDNISPETEQKKLLCLAMFESNKDNFDLSLTYATTAIDHINQHTSLQNSILQIQSILIFLNIKSNYVHSDQKMIQQLQLAYTACKQNNYYKFIDIVTTYIDCHIMEKNYDPIYEILEDIKKINSKTLKKDILYCYHYGMGRINFALNNREEAIKHYLICTKNTKILELLYARISYSYYLLHDYERALEYAELGQIECIKNKNESQYYDCSSLIISYRFLLGKKINKSLFALVDKVINYNKKFDAAAIQNARIYEKIGSYYLSAKKYSIALQYFQDALQSINNNKLFARDILNIKQKIIKTTLLIQGSDDKQIQFYDIFFKDFENHFLEIVKRKEEKNYIEFQTKEKEQEIHHLKSIDAYKKRLLTNITHDIRTPISLILAPLENTIANTTNPEDKYNLQLAYSNAQRLEFFLDQLLDITKIEEGLLKPKFVYGNIIDFMQTIFQSFQIERKINFSSSINIADQLCFFDAEAFSKIIYNLVSNAIKFSSPDSTIDILLQYKNDSIILIVKDYGIGIHENEIDRIFDRFYQVEKGNTRVYKGSGIGLSIVKDYTLLLGGDIAVNSVLNKGTTFSITIPYKRSLSNNEIESTMTDFSFPRNNFQTLITPNLSKENIEENQSEKDTLLLIDDNEELRQFLRFQLEKTYQIIEAKNGNEGWQKTKKYLPNIIISDIMMPEMDGITLCSIIKKNEKTNHIPVILLSAKASVASELEGYDAMADTYIKKPFNIEILKAALHAIITNRDIIQNKIQNAIRDNLIDKLNIDTDTTFIKSFYNVIENNLYAADINVNFIAKELNMNRMTLLRKVKHFTGKKPKEIIMETKLNNAKILLEKKNSTVKNIAYKLGFLNLDSFYKSYKKKFGVTPINSTKK